MIVQKITISELLEDPSFPCLIHGYERECAMAGMPPCSPSFVMYKQFAEHKLLDVFGAYEDDYGKRGGLIGFACLLTTVVPHYGAPASCTESIYVDPAWRKSGAGLALINACKARAKERDSVVMFTSAPVGSKLERVLSRIKSSQPANTVFVTKL